MPARSNKFQRLITLLHGLLGKEGKVTESAMVPEINSGKLREVDILLEVKTHAYNVSIAVEVVGRSRRSDVTWVEQMHTKHMALGTNKLILVSERGFSQSAMEKAQELGHEAISIESALGVDWKLLSKLDGMRIFEITNFKYKLYAIHMLDGQLVQTELPPSQKIHAGGADSNAGQIVQMLLKEPTGKATLDENIKNGERKFWISYQDPAMWVIDHSAVGATSELRIDIEVEHSSTPLQFSAGVYKDMPFIEGVGAGHGNSSHLVMTKRDDGSYDVIILDAEGLRRLTLTPDPGSEM